MANLNDVIKRLKDEGKLTRNTGKNSIKSLKDPLEAIRTSSQEIFNAISTQSGAIGEQLALQKKQFEQAEQDALAQRDAAREATSSQTETGSKITGAGIGAAASGIGAGLKSMGIAALFGAGATALLSFLDLDVKKIKENVVELLSIQDEFEGGAEGFFKKGGTFFAAMTGIGIGLAAFGIGAGLVALSQFLAPDDWAQRVVDNVTTLLGINKLFDGFGGALVEGGTFFVAMTAIGAGLGVFGVGSALAGLSQFILSDDWAQRVVDNVTTLLGINKLFKGFGDALVKGGTFFVAMTAIGAGLAVFGAGSAVAGVLTSFQDPNWSQTIVDNVKTLLSISSLPGIGMDTAIFGAVMTGIAAGLVAFAIGKAGNATGDAISKFTGNFADNIVKDVKTLLGMLGDDNINVEQSNKFLKVMTNLGLGLGAFALAKGMNALADIGTAISGFLTGEQGPIKQLLNLAGSVGDLERVGGALEKISTSLSSFANIRINTDDMDLQKLIMKLGKALPNLEALANGGKLDGSGFFRDIKIKGLLSPDLKLDEMVDAINKVNQVLGFQPQMQASAEVNQVLGFQPQMQAAAVNVGSVDVAESQRGVGVTNNFQTIAPVTSTNFASGSGGGSSSGMAPPRRAQIRGPRRQSRGPYG
jgi:hypothetical protein